jgi:hypothetical protein
MAGEAPKRTLSGGTSPAIPAVNGTAPGRVPLPLNIGVKVSIGLELSYKHPNRQKTCIHRDLTHVSGGIWTMCKVQRISSLGSGTRITQPGGKETVRQKMGKHFHTTEALFPQDMDYYGFICPGR